MYEKRSGLRLRANEFAARSLDPAAWGRGLIAHDKHHLTYCPAKQEASPALRWSGKPSPAISATRCASCLHTLLHRAQQSLGGGGGIHLHRAGAGGGNGFAQGFEHA